MLWALRRGSRSTAIKRLTALSALLVTLGIFSARSSLAGDSLVPEGLQAQLLAKLAGYDRNFASRAGSTAVILLVVRPDDAASSLNAAVMKAQLEDIELVGGLPHRELVLAFESGPALAQQVRSRRAAIVYFASGLDDKIAELQAALDGVNVLSVAAEPGLVPRGAVLGFELVSGKPKLLLNLSQAKRQNVSFGADVLKLMKVYR